MDKLKQKPAQRYKPDKPAQRYKPDKPAQRYKPDKPAQHGTTNTFLENKAKELHLKNFRGVVFRNNFKDMTPLEKECGIYGSKSDTENMHHWCAWYKDKNKLYCFDSFGLPPTKEVIKYLKQGDNSKKILYSTFQIQKFDESTCGEYCLYFLDNINKGNKYVDVILSLVNNSTF